MRIDYPALEVLNARARRERAEAVHRLLVAPVIRFLTKPSAPKPALRARHA
jgi:hypothetical protein